MSGAGRAIRIGGAIHSRAPIHGGGAVRGGGTSPSARAFLPAVWAGIARPDRSAWHRAKGTGGAARLGRARGTFASPVREACGAAA